MIDDLARIPSSLYAGDYQAVPTLVRKCLDQGLKPGEILEQGLIPGMDRVGQDFKAGTLYVPEVLIAARAMHAGMDLLRPLLAGSGAKTLGKCVIGSVQGDLHDIGKNLVKMMLEGAGFEMIDLGTDVDPARFVEAVREHQPKLVGISALLTTTMQGMKTTVDVLRSAGVRDSVKVLVGGAPVTETFARECGADGYASNAAAAVDTARSLTA
jgi:5-methyltetrahydrofolate--homocysteine methyltransferase